MNKYVKQYLQRGLTFGGFGPIILGIVYLILDNSIPDFTVSGGEILLGIISTYVIAFVQAGSSVFNQIEHWPLAKSLAIHLGSLYAVYSAAYLINTWIPFEPIVLLIFTAIFLAVYFSVWLTVYFSVKVTSKKMSKRL